MTLTYRLVKGSELTHSELDGNFSDLDAKALAAASAISANTSAVATNASAIAANTSAISANTSAITDLDARLDAVEPLASAALPATGLSSAIDALGVVKANTNPITGGIEKFTAGAQELYVTDGRALQIPADSVADSPSESFVDGLSPWTRVFGPNEMAAFTKSAEVASTAKKVTAQSAANGPAMFRKEGASIYFDGALMSANFGNIRTTTANLTGLANTTIALLVYIHKLNTNSAVLLRVGADTGNYVSYRWGADENLLQEGWNVLLASTSEAIGGNSVGQRHFQGAINTGWIASAGTYVFSTTANYVAIELNGMTGTYNTHCWVEGLYRGGIEKTRLTIGFDISSSGLNLAKQCMDDYGFKGYAAVPTANADTANPAFLWDAATVDRLQGIHNAGWDVIQHSVSHNSLGSFTDESMILSEFEGCRQAIRQLGAERAADFFATPNGSTSNRVVYLAKMAGIRWLRNVGKGKMLNSTGLVGLENPLNIGCFDMANRTDTVEFQAYIDLLRTYGVSGHLYTHSIVTGASDSVNTNETVFRNMLAILKPLSDAGLVEVLPPTQWLMKSTPPSLSTALRLPNRLVVTIGTSPFNYINTGYEPMLVMVSGGTVSSITYSRDGMTFDPTGQTSGTFVVLPGDRLQITYTVIPTVIQMRAST